MALVLVKVLFNQNRLLKSVNILFYSAFILKKLKFTDDNNIILKCPHIRRKCEQI